MTAFKSTASLRNAVLSKAEIAGKPFRTHPADTCKYNFILYTGIRHHKGRIKPIISYRYLFCSHCKIQQSLLGIPTHNGAI